MSSEPKPVDLMPSDLHGKCVLVTGGTRGIGLATGLAFGRLGAQVTLTHRWGSADEDELRAAFAEAGAPPPDIVESDTGHPEDLDELLAHLAERHEGVEVYVPNVAFAPVVRGLEDYQRRGLLRGIEYTAWPLVEGTLAIHRRFGRYPRYVVGLTSAGPTSLFVNYDMAAAAKAVLETLARYLDYRLFEEDCRVNLLCPRWVETASLSATFGEGFADFVARFPTPNPFVSPEEVGDAAVALCSGFMDGVSGQVLTLDHGAGFQDNFMRLYADFLQTETPSTRPDRSNP